MVGRRGRRGVLLTRLISVAAALSVLVPLLVWGGWLGAYAIVVIVIVWAQWEYASLAFPARRARTFALLTLLGLGLAAAVLSERFAVLVSAIALAMIACAWWVLFTPRESAAGMHGEWSRLFLGVLYVPLPLALFPPLRMLPNGRGLSWLLVTMAATWGGDGGGYIFGRLFGRHKLFPLISPKKTWEGLAGGVVFGILLCAGFKLALFPYLRWIDCALYPVVIDLAGVSGDLVESMIKRDVGVKDSGVFLPGHGGMLDRIDSIIFALPFAYAYVRLIAG
jgi:phosphatidate cytidylyltransferase